MDEDRYMFAPLGLMFVTMGDNHEQVSFAYPFQSDSSVSSGLLLSFSGFFLFFSVY